jgi:hypothetical protein
MITGLLHLGWHTRSANADPCDQASRLIIEWTADL